MVSLINDKADGFLDELSPVLQLTEELSEGCDDGSLALPATDMLRSLHGSNLTAVLQGCSNEVAATSAAARRLALGPPRSVVISPYSSAANIMNESLFPNVARTIANTGNTATAAAAACINLGWKRVAALHDDSDWGISTYREFERSLFALEPDAELLVPSADRTFDRTQCMADARDEHNRTVAQQLLARLEAVDARVIKVLTHPSCYRRILAESYRSKKLHGAGFAWLAGWT